MTQKEVRVVGRCTQCDQPVLEVVDVEVSSTGAGIKVNTRIFRRCGCGDFYPAD